MHPENSGVNNQEPTLCPSQQLETIEQYAFREGQCRFLLPRYITDRKMSTVLFNLPASNHLVIIPLQCLVEARKKG